MTVTIWHNPRCSKSRQTLALLEEHGITPHVRLYLEDAPSEAEIGEVLGLLGIQARDLVRKSEVEYMPFAEADDATLIEAMARIPKLIERPVVLANGKAAIGRPPENVLGIL